MINVVTFPGIQFQGHIQGQGLVHTVAGVV